MKAFLSFAFLVFFSAPDARPGKNDFSLPELHIIRRATLSPSYSCRSEKHVQYGYAKTALFLSTYSERMNSPDLLFNGACKSEDYFEGSTAGDDMSLIADLGTVSLEDVTSSSAFNVQRIHSFNLYSRFAELAKVEAHHTYALVINKSGVRGLLVFFVEDYQPNKQVNLSYAVKEYQILNVKAQSKGFDWSEGNRPIAAQLGCKIVPPC